jgi:hypothetical protein
MSRDKKIELWVVIVITVLWLLLPIAAFAGDSLEVEIVTPTKHGPLLDYDHGCFEYGNFYASVVAGRAKGIKVPYYLQLVDTSPYRDAIPGMHEFMTQQVRHIFALPVGFLAVPYADTRQRAIDYCRSRKGMTWLFTQGV